VFPINDSGSGVVPLRVNPHVDHLYISELLLIYSFFLFASVRYAVRLCAAKVLYRTYISYWFKFRVV
jgi:hypothetical protein